jgi:hypothetical protein
MPILPTSRPGWLSFALFPFKVYIVLAGIALSFWVSALPWHPIPVTRDVGGFLLAGYLVSAIVLFFGGLTQASVGPRGSAFPTLVFAGVALIITVLLLPMLSAAKTG